MYGDLGLFNQHKGHSLRTFIAGLEPETHTCREYKDTAGKGP